MLTRVGCACVIKWSESQLCFKRSAVSFQPVDIYPILTANRRFILKAHCAGNVAFAMVKRHSPSLTQLYINSDRLATRRQAPRARDRWKRPRAREEIQDFRGG